MRRVLSLDPYFHLFRQVYDLLSSVFFCEISILSFLCDESKNMSNTIFRS